MRATADSCRCSGETRVKIHNDQRLKQSMQHQPRTLSVDASESPGDMSRNACTMHTHCKQITVSQVCSQGNKSLPIWMRIFLDPPLYPLHYFEMINLQLYTFWKRICVTATQPRCMILLNCFIERHVVAHAGDDSVSSRIHDIFMTYIQQSFTRALGPPTASFCVSME